MEFEFVPILGAIILILWIFGFWSARKAMTGFALWTLFCAAMAAGLLQADKFMSPESIYHPVIDIAIGAMIFLFVVSIVFAPALVLAFGIREKQPETYVAKTVCEAYEHLSPEEQAKVRHGGKIVLGVATGYLADRAERKGNKNVARKLSDISEQM